MCVSVRSVSCCTDALALFFLLWEVIKRHLAFCVPYSVTQSYAMGGVAVGKPFFFFPQWHAANRRCAKNNRKQTQHSSQVMAKWDIIYDEIALGLWFQLPKSNPRLYQCEMDGMREERAGAQSHLADHVNTRTPLWNRYKERRTNQISTNASLKYRTTKKKHGGR